MATTAEHIPERDLLRQYLRALASHGGGPTRHLGRPSDVRTCARCGEEADFRVDPEGSWAACRSCGAYA